MRQGELSSANSQKWFGKAHQSAIGAKENGGERPSRLHGRLQMPIGSRPTINHIMFPSHFRGICERLALRNAGLHRIGRDGTGTREVTPDGLSLIP